MHCINECCTIITKPYTQQYPILYNKNSIKGGMFIFDPFQNKILLVQSRGQLWGPPKGSLELNENIKQCAIREVKEETGLDIDEKVLINYYTVEKKATYFYIELEEKNTQIQEFENNDASGITWIKLDCLKKMLSENKIKINKHCKVLLRKIFQIIVY